MEFTREEIEAFKKKHGEIYLINQGAFSCIISRPSRATISLAMSNAQGDRLKMVDVIYANHWLAGDEIMKEDQGLLVGALSQIDDILGAVRTEVKKL